MMIIYVPCKNGEEAKSIAKTLVTEKLAACTNIIPTVYSVFLWEGKVEEGEESVLIIKTLDTLVDKVFSRIKQLHSYKTPVIYSLKADKVSKETSSWMNQELIFGKLGF
jgi:periplasmic divalent cation tolerance protein